MIEIISHINNEKPTLVFHIETPLREIGHLARLASFDKSPFTRIFGLSGIR